MKHRALTRLSAVKTSPVTFDRGLALVLFALGELQITGASVRARIRELA